MEGQPLSCFLSEKQRLSQKFHADFCLHNIGQISATWPPFIIVIPSTLYQRDIYKKKENQTKTYTKEQTKEGFKEGFFSVTNENKYRKTSDQYSNLSEFG